MFFIILRNNNIFSDRYKLIFERKNKALTDIHNYYKSNNIKNIHLRGPLFSLFGLEIEKLAMVTVSL